MNNNQSSTCCSGDTFLNMDKEKGWRSRGGYLLLFMLIVGSIISRVVGYMHIYMGAMLLLLGGLKLIDRKGFAVSFSRYDTIARYFPVRGLIYPFVEGLLGVCFLLGGFIGYASIATIGILLSTMIGVVRSLVKKEKLQCACIGSHFALPVGRLTLVETGLMMFMCFWMLFSPIH